MKKFALNLLISFGISLSFTGNTSAKESMNVFVWKVTDKSQKQTNYLVGTMHLPFGEKYSLPPKVLEQIKSSKSFTMEANLELNAEAIMALQKYSMLEEKGNLKDLVSQNDWSKLLTKFEPLGYGEDTLNMIEPWLLYIQLVMPQKNIQDLNNTLDLVLKKEAMNNNLKLDYFETQDEQFKLIDSNPVKDDIGILMEYINNPEKESNRTEESEKAYLSGNIENFEKEFSDYYSKTYPGYYKNMVIDRNNRWLPKLEKMINQGNSFVAVGLGHLIGKKGLLEVLKAKGYKIDRVKVL